MTSDEIPTPRLTCTLPNGTMLSFESVENVTSDWDFGAKDILKVEGIIDGKVNFDRKVDNSFWRMGCSSATGGT